MTHPIPTFWSVDDYDGPGVSRIEMELLTADEKCPACGQTRSGVRSYRNTKLHVIGPGEVWPDILNGMPVLHERVVEAMDQEKLSGYIAHPAVIVEIDWKQGTLHPKPRYFAIEITGRVDIDLDELDEHGGGACPLCFVRRGKQGPYQWQVKRIVPKLETWDGSDFVKVRNWHTLRIYSTRRFVDLACKYKWTNFRLGDAAPRVNILEPGKCPDGGISYHDPAWYEKASEWVKSKHPDLFVGA